MEVCLTSMPIGFKRLFSGISFLMSRRVQSGSDVEMRDTYKISRGKP